MMAYFILRALLNEGRKSTFEGALVYSDLRSLHLIGPKSGWR
jgi:hypothetical protein